MRLAMFLWLLGNSKNSLSGPTCTTLSVLQLPRLMRVGSISVSLFSAIDQSGSTSRLMSFTVILFQGAVSKILLALFVLAQIVLSLKKARKARKPSSGQDRASGDGTL